MAPAPLNRSFGSALLLFRSSRMLKRLWQRVRERLRPGSRGGGGPFPGRHAAWPKTLSEFEEFWSDGDARALYLEPTRLAFYQEVLSHLPAHPCRLLDLGCGGGHFLRLVADRWRGQGPPLLVGLDFAESAVRSAARVVPEAAFRRASANATGFPDGSFDIVLAMELFEHLAKPDRLLKEAWRLVAPGGRLVITIPDGDQDTWVGHTNFWSADAFARFLRPLPVASVHRLDQRRVLMFEIAKLSEQAIVPPRYWRSLRARLGGWSRARLRSKGWDLIRYQPRPTYLPELSRYTSQAFVRADLAVQPGSVVLDVGSGHYPFPHATILSDLHTGSTPHRTENLARDGRPFVVFDIHRMPFRNRSVDFVYCSHVLEHVENPGRACAELARVARGGYVETPTLGKDVLFAWGKGRHRWHVVAIGNRLVFFEYMSRQVDGIRSSAWRDLIFGEAYHPLQEAYYANEDVFNVMFRWRGRFDWVVYRLDGSVETSAGLSGAHRAWERP